MIIYHKVLKFYISISNLFIIRIFLKQIIKLMNTSFTIFYKSSNKLFYLSINNFLKFIRDYNISISIKSKRSTLNPPVEEIDALINWVCKHNFFHKIMLNTISINVSKFSTLKYITCQSPILMTSSIIFKL